MLGKRLGKWGGQLLGLTKNGAYAAAKRGELPVIRIGKLIKVPKKAFDRMLEEARPEGGV